MHFRWIVLALSLGLLAGATAYWRNHHPAWHTPSAADHQIVSHISPELAVCTRSIDSTTKRDSLVEWSIPTGRLISEITLPDAPSFSEHATTLTATKSQDGNKYYLVYADALKVMGENAQLAVIDAKSGAELQKRTRLTFFDVYGTLPEVVSDRYLILMNLNLFVGFRLLLSEIVTKETIFKLDVTRSERWPSYLVSEDGKRLIVLRVTKANQTDATLELYDLPQGTLRKHWSVKPYVAWQKIEAWNQSELYVSVKFYDAERQTNRVYRVDLNENEDTVEGKHLPWLNEYSDTNDRREVVQIGKNWVSVIETKRDSGFNVWKEWMSWLDTKFGNSNWFTSYGMKTFRLLDLKTGEIIFEIPGLRPRKVLVTADGRYAVVQTELNAVEVWSLKEPPVYRWPSCWGVAVGVAVLACGRWRYLRATSKKSTPT